LGEIEEVSPQLNREREKINTDASLGSCIDISRCFNWFDKQFVPNLNQLTKDFFNINLEIFLLAITYKPSIIWKGDDYFVTQIKITEDTSISFRISNTAAQLLFDNALGKNEKQKGMLDLKNITELEAYILTAYNEHLFKGLNDAFRTVKSIKKHQKESSDKLIHLTFCISKNKEETGKIILSFPQKVIRKPEPVKLPEKFLNVFNFYNSYTEASIYVGKSKICLEDLSNLEPDDFIVLENSNINQMILNCEKALPFQVNPNINSIINVNTDGGDQIVNDLNSCKSLWDSLQVEVSAEFQKIKLSLGELKQITEGLVVDIASIAQNKITLHIDGKKIANGELVIINDRYGVKINEVFQSTEQENAALKQQQLVQQKSQSVVPVSVSDSKTSVDNVDDSDDDDDFDYSDFEIEDDIL